MNALHRYIFKQTLIATGMAVGLFAFVVVAWNAAKDDVFGLLASGQLSIQMFLQTLVLLVPYAVSYALPLGLLTGVLVVLGRLSAQNEITAIKTAGISLYHIVATIVLIALCGMFFSIFFNFYYSPITRTQYRESIANLLRHDPLQLIKPRTFIKDFPGLIIYVGSRSDKKLKDFRVWELDNLRRVTLYVQAERGEFTYDRERDAMVLTGYNAVAEKRPRNDPEDLQNMTLIAPTSREVQFRIPMSKLIGDDSVHRKLSMLTLGELLAARNHTLARERSGDEGAYAERIRIQMQIQKNFVFAFAILSLALVAIPLGIKASRTETYANFAIAIGLCMAFYVSVIILSWLEKTPHLRPDLLIWAPNLVCQGLGFYLIHRSNER